MAVYMHLMLHAYNTALGTMCGKSSLVMDTKYQQLSHILNMQLSMHLSILVQVLMPWLPEIFPISATESIYTSSVISYNHWCLGCRSYVC